MYFKPLTMAGSSSDVPDCTNARTTNAVIAGPTCGTHAPSLSCCLSKNSTPFFSASVGGDLNVNSEIAPPAPPAPRLGAAVCPEAGMAKVNKARQAIELRFMSHLAKQRTL